jgi:hypothetical protein
VLLLEALVSEGVSMGRQMYHRSVLNALILSILFITGCNGLLNNPDSSNADLLSSPDFIQTEGEIDAIVSQIEDKHSIRVYYKKGPLFSWLVFKYKLAPKSDYAKLLRYLAVLQTELNKYPDGFLQEAGIKSIVVCNSVSSHGLSAHGFADTRGKSIYCTYGGFHTYLKKTIHHEIYHLIEAKHTGSPYYKDPVWTAFNDSEFKYEEAAPFDPEEFDEKKLFHPNKGFITSGAKSAPWQDKAEVYAGLFVEEISTCLHEWISEDEILRNKVNYMKDFLLQHSDEMTSDFWANLCTGECSPLDLTAVSSYETQDFRFSAVLSDNAAAELIAITEGSGNSTKWWKPNGEIFDEAPFTIDDPVTTVDDEFKQYRFFFYARTGQSPWSTSSLDLPGGRIYRAEQTFRGKDGRIFLNVWVMTCGWDKDKEASQMVIGIPLGKWITKATYNPRTKVTSGPDYSVKFDKPHREKGKLKIDISHNISDFRKTAKQIVAVDHTGKIHHPVSTQAEVNKRGQKTSLCFGDLRVAQVKEFQYKVCPYTWVTFENISLRPGQITDVQVKVGNN